MSEKTPVGLLLEKWLAEAEACDKLADRFKFDSELRTQYESHAMRLRGCYYDLKKICPQS